MSTTIHDERQRLVDEMVVELQELSDRRYDLLREMFRLVQYGQSGNVSVLLGEEDTDEGELERFLERFALRKNLETGSILTLDTPELRLETVHSRRSSPIRKDEEYVSKIVPHSDDVKHTDDEGDLLYPTTSPLSFRTQLPKVAESSVVEDEAMDVDEPVEADEAPAVQVQEEAPVNIEDEEEPDQQMEEPRTPPRTRARTRTTSPIAPRRGKRRRSDISEEHEPVDDVGKLQVPSDDVRQTRSKARKVTPPPPVAMVEDEDVDELDIISLSSPSNISPPQRRTSPRELRSQSVRSEAAPANEVAEQDDQVEPQGAEVEEESVEPTKIEEQNFGGEKFVPPSPSTPSVRSPSKSPSPQLPRPESREPPIRAPRPREPHIVDTTPLTPPRSPPPPIVVHLPLRQPEKPVYHFVEVSSASQSSELEVKAESETTLPTSEPERPRTYPVDMRLMKRPAFHYSLPPVSALPAEFNRKGKPTKSRKRDKERERSGSDAGRKDDWVPLGMAKWAALLVANPAYKKLGRATKCVTTRDWNTASTELKVIRTLERIEVLKRMGKWSFRQLKKQRVAAGLVKTHWDYLMDEMKWMQVDFREERRWKIALAYELALSVQEWHAAGSHEERILLGICARWRKPDPLELLPVDEQQPMEVDIVPPLDDELDLAYPEETQPEERPVQATASDNEDEDVEDQRAVTAALMLENAVADVGEDTHQAFTVPDPAEVPSIMMKLEEVEGADVLHLTEVANNNENNQVLLQLPQDTSNHWTELPKTEAIDASHALKETSNNPTMDAEPTTSESAPEATQKEQKSPWTPEQTKILRSSILSLPEETLFVSMDQFVPISDEELMKSLAPEEGSNEVPPSFDLTSVFPELQPFSMIDIPNSEIAGASVDGKKKNDRKADKDDPTKRVEETTYTKLCPTSRFMYIKPTLVSALQPAKKWRKGKWIDLDESPVMSDVDSPPPFSGPENSCTLFEGRRISIPFQPPLVLHNFSKLPRNTVKTAEIPWSQAEDNLLKSLAERYPSNWRLVADALNSSRIRTSIDLRTPLECFERWRSKYVLPTRPMHSSIVQNMQLAAPFLNNEEAALTNSGTGGDTAPPPSTAASVGTSQMTTRGIKRQATSAAQNALNLSINTGAATVESRKRKRHLIIYEAVRKTLARRQKQRKQDELKYQSSASVVPVHDTHHQFGAQTRYTPLQLSQMKAERERKEMDLQIARRRELEAKRQQQQQQQQQLHAQLQQAQQQQQQMSQQSVALSQNVPQIRTQVGISQHQQQTLTAQVGTIPLSPQMMQQAQQARVLQAQAQGQVQQAQAQPSLSQLQGQMANAQPNVNGVIPHLSAQYANHGGATSPVTQHASPPRSGATPVNSVATFPRPPSAQRNVAMSGSQILPMAGGSVPIARTNNALAAYFANSGYTQEQMTQLMRYQQQQHVVQQAQQQLQMQQQQQQPLQMQMQAGQQNTHQGGITGYPTTGQ